MPRRKDIISPLIDANKLSQTKEIGYLSTKSKIKTKQALIQTKQDAIFNELSKVIRTNKQKEIDLDHEKFSMDGCFEAMIVNKLCLNRAGMEEIRKRPQPVYTSTRQKKEEIAGFKEYFKLKKDLHEGNLERKALSSWEDIHALFVISKKKRKERKEEQQFMRRF